MCAENKNNRQNVYKFIIQLTGILVGAILLGFVLLVLAYMLPTERMRQNVAVTTEQINTEGQYYQWAKGYKNAQTDTYTDASLLLNAMYPGSGSAVRDAMNAPRDVYKRQVPVCACKSPSRISTIVDLPAPEVPIIPTDFPLGTIICASSKIFLSESG